jgi:hypothetical protein
VELYSSAVVANVRCRRPDWHNYPLVPPRSSGSGCRVRALLQVDDLGASPVARPRAYAPLPLPAPRHFRLDEAPVTTRRSRLRGRLLAAASERSRQSRAGRPWHNNQSRRVAVVKQRDGGRSAASSATLQWLTVGDLGGAEPLDPCWMSTLATGASGCLRLVQGTAGWRGKEAGRRRRSTHWVARSHLSRLKGSPKSGGGADIEPPHHHPAWCERQQASEWARCSSGGSGGGGRRRLGFRVR